LNEHAVFTSSAYIRPHTTVAEREDGRVDPSTCKWQEEKLEGQERMQEQSQKRRKRETDNR
jgi:hypothetical protein